MKAGRVVLAVGVVVAAFAISGRGQDVRAFSLSSVSGALLGGFDWTHEKWSFGPAAAIDSRRRLFQAGLQLNLQGSVYHPELLTFRLDFNLVGLNSKRQMFADSSVNNSLNNTYDGSVTLFGKKPLSLDLYALRYFATTDRAFLERYFVTTESAGARLVSRWTILPFQLDVYRSRMRSESEIFRERQEKSDNIDFRAILVQGEKSNSSLSAQWKDYEESVYHVRFRSLDMLADYSQSYGKNNRNRVNYLVTFNQMRGDYALERWQFRIGENLYLSSNFSTGGTYSYTIDSSFGRSYQRLFITRSLDYQLFESLTASIQAGGRWESSSFQKIRGWSVQWSLGYQKTIPSGSIQLNYAGRAENNRYASQGGSLQASDFYNFGPGDVIFLSLPSINVKSILVANPELSAVYLEGADYRVDVIGGQVALTRLPGGALPSGARVLIQFEYLSYPDFRLDSRFNQFQARLTFLKYLQVFYQGGASTRSVVSDYVIPPFENYTRRSYGAGITSSLIKAEYSLERYRSSLAEYDSRYVQASAGGRVFGTLVLSVQYNLRWLQYIPDVFSSRFESYSLESSLSVAENLTATGVYRVIRYSTRLYSREGESLGVKVQWNFRKVALGLFYEHILQGFDNERRLRDYFFLSLRRAF
jgi:hypothetical protein